MRTKKMADLPAHLIESAWGDPTDRARVYAWNRRVLAEAVEALRQRGYAILGGDVWVVTKDGKLRPDNPRTGESRRGWCWGAPDKDQVEPWADFVDRCARHTLRWIEDVDPDRTLPIESDETIIYEPTWISEKEYQELCAKRGA